MKFMTCVLLIGIQWQASYGQAIDDERMKRDIEVAENVLATLIKHEIGQQRTFFGLDVTGSYQPGYGVTFRLPSNQLMPIVFTISGADIQGPATVISDGTGYRYSIRTNGGDKGVLAETESYKLHDKSMEKADLRADSIRQAYNESMIKAARDFILDYGDFISQLGPNEKIVVTNQP